MRKHRLPQKVCLFVILLAVLGWGLNTRIHRSGETGSDTEQQSVIMDVARGIFDREPSEVQDLREQSIAETDADKFRDLVISQQLIKDIHALSSAVPRQSRGADFMQSVTPLRG